MKYDVIIIGAGMSGVAAGIRLAMYDKKVCVLEKHAIPGGLNSYYSKDGRRFDVGLHAMTNFVDRKVKSAPLNKLLRQLRLRYDDLDLVEQSYSTIDFPDVTLKFGNSFTLLEGEVARAFPSQIDGFRRLVECIRDYNEVSLTADYISSRQTLQQYLSDPMLIDMIFCPVMYYGSAVEEDMDFSQFCIMFKSIFFEGFSRPQKGVRTLTRLLQNRLKGCGADCKFRHGVKQILSKNGRAYAVELENGDILEADKIISSVGLRETYNLIDPTLKEQEKFAVGKLSFVESLLVLDKNPKDLGLDQTITFFSKDKEFRYRSPKGQAFDPRSGVICLPNNFQYTDNPLNEGMVRFTSLADYDLWSQYPEDEYQAMKDEFVKAQIEHSGFGDKIRNHITYVDAFTPRTVHKYTSHINGAIYGSPQKIKDGRTSLENVYLCGTDQGFLGIVGALLSGISIANLHALR